MIDFFQLCTEWLLHYGSFILFVLLALGIVGLPIPDETLLVAAGWLIAQEKLSPLPTMLASFAGAICGISASYWLGSTTGPYLVKKLGKRLSITEEKMELVRKWFSRIGKWTLFIGYFIPVVRHLTGYAAGSSKLKFKQFMLFSYSGAIVWTLSFLIIGYLLGSKAHNMIFPI